MTVFKLPLVVCPTAERPTHGYELGQILYDTDDSKFYELTAKGPHTWTLVDLSGGASAAPPNAQYLTLATNGSLSAERVLVAGTGLDLTDGGANGNATLDIDSTVTTLTGSQTLTNKTLTNPTINGETRASASKTGAYTLDTPDRHIRADASSAGFTLTLPTASGITGKIYKIKKIDSTNNIVVIDANSTETIDGLLTWELRNPLEFVEIISDGTNWNVVDFTEPSIHAFRRKGTTENRWYIGGLSTGGALSTGAVVANNLYATPFMVTYPITVNDMAVNVTTAVAATNIRIGIYKDKNNYPVDLVVEAGEVPSSNNNTFQSVNIASGQKLQPGLYWLSIAVSGGPTLRYIVNTSTMSILGTDNGAATTTPSIGWVHSFTYAALPSTFPNSAPSVATANMPAIYARFV